LIIGGHTHSFLSKPELITREKSGATLVNQVGFGGINLGRIDFILGDGKLKKIHNLIEVV
jgi:5'-nucleotidase